MLKNGHTNPPLHFLPANCTVSPLSHHFALLPFYHLPFAFAVDCLGCSFLSTPTQLYGVWAADKPRAINQSAVWRNGYEKPFALNDNAFKVKYANEKLDLDSVTTLL